MSSPQFEEGVLRGEKPSTVKTDMTCVGARFFSTDGQHHGRRKPKRSHGFSQGLLLGQESLNCNNCNPKGEVSSCRYPGRILLCVGLLIC